MVNGISDNREISICEITNIVKKRFLSFLVIFSLIFLVFIGFVIFNKPIYTLNATINIEPIVNLTAWENTQSEKKLESSDMHYLSSKSTILAALKDMNFSIGTENKKNDYYDILTNKRKQRILQESIKTSVYPNSTLVTISIANKDPIFAQDFLDALIIAFETELIEISKLQLESERQILINKISSAEQNFASIITEFERLKTEAVDDGNITLKDIIEGTNSKSQEIQSNTAFDFLKITNPLLIEKIGQIEKESTLLNDFRSQLLSLDAFSSSTKKAVIVIDEPMLIDENGETDNYVILIAGLFFAVFVSFSSILYFEFSSDKIDDVFVLRRLIGKKIPILDVIPKKRPPNEDYLEIIDSPNSSMSASINSLAGILAYSGKKAYTISSLGEDYEATVLIINIAISLIRDGKRVLVVEASNKLSNKHDLVHQITSNPDFANKIEVTTIGSSPHFKDEKDKGFLCLCSIEPTMDIPVGTIDNQQMETYVKHAAEAFDLIVINETSLSKPSKLLSSLKVTEGLILYVNSQTGSKKQYTKLKHLLDVCETPVLGVVFD